MVIAASPSLRHPPAPPACGSTSWRSTALVFIRGRLISPGSRVDDAVFVFFLRPPHPTITTASPTRRRPPRERLPPRYPETAVGTPVIDYIDDEPFLPEQPGKPPYYQISPIPSLYCLH
ncbi:hypothetical protein ACQJBY_022561 [Aegilops geniculata]